MTPRRSTAGPVRKYNYLDGHLAESTRNVAGYNIYFIRLPDIYLMYAELLKDSDPTTALEYVNKVHRRAYNRDPDSPSDIDYASLTDRTKADADDHLANNPLLYVSWGRNVRRDAAGGKTCAVCASANRKPNTTRPYRVPEPQRPTSYGRRPTMRCPYRLLSSSRTPIPTWYRHQDIDNC